MDQKIKPSCNIRSTSKPIVYICKYCNMMSNTYNPDDPLYKLGYCCDECRENHTKGIVFSTLYLNKLQDIYKNMNGNRRKNEKEN